MRSNNQLQPKLQNSHLSRLYQTKTDNRNCCEQRFLFDTNYLTSIHDIQLGDVIDCMICDNDSIHFGFKTQKIESIQINKNKNEKLIKLSNVRKWYKWSQIVCAKPGSICGTPNQRFTNLQVGQFVRFRHAFLHTDVESASWFNGTVIGEREGQVEIRYKVCKCCQGRCPSRYTICINDACCLQIKHKQWGWV